MKIWMMSVYREMAPKRERERESSGQTIVVVAEDSHVLLGKNLVLVGATDNGLRIDDQVDAEDERADEGVDHVEDRYLDEGQHDARINPSQGAAAPRRRESLSSAS